MMAAVGSRPVGKDPCCMLHASESAINKGRQTNSKSAPAAAQCGLPHLFTRSRCADGGGFHARLFIQLTFLCTASLR